MWTDAIRAKPEYLNTRITEAIAKMKGEVTLFYFNHESSGLKDGPEMWFEDVLLAYKNILAGRDMQETRSTLTGMSTEAFDLPSEFVSNGGNEVKINAHLLRPQKYALLQSAMQSLNTTACFSLAHCHEIRMKVCSAFFYLRM